jgi:hypothetical protein
MSGSRWEPNRAEAHLVVSKLCEGNLLKPIAQEVYPDQNQTAAIERVKKLIPYALDNGILEYRPAVIEGAHDPEGLQDKLQYQFPYTNRFHIVNDELLDPETCTFAVATEAARVTADRLYTLLGKRDGSGDVTTIGNAGGPSIYHLVKNLPAHVRLPGKSSSAKLKSISLNHAFLPESYDCAANALCVQIAGLYNCGHFATSRSLPPGSRVEYEEWIDRLDLVLCGIGSRRGLVYQWDEGKDFPLPPEMVGDICLNPIDANGKPVEFSGAGKSKLEQIWQPKPDYQAIKEHAKNDRIILIVIAHHEHTTTNGGDIGDAQEKRNRDVQHKAAIARAALSQGLTKCCVMSASMARAVLNS